MKRWQVWFWGPKGQLIFWALVGVLGWWLFAQRPGAARPWALEPREPAALVPASSSSAPVDSGSWTQVARATMPAVVNIYVTGIVPARGRGPEMPSTDPFLGLFFGFLFLRLVLLHRARRGVEAMQHDHAVGDLRRW